MRQTGQKPVTQLQKYFLRKHAEAGDVGRDPANYGPSPFGGRGLPEIAFREKFGYD